MAVKWIEVDMRFALEAFGRDLRSWRTSEGLTQVECDELMGTSGWWISVENNNKANAAYGVVGMSNFLKACNLANLNLSDYLVMVGYK